MFYTKQKKASKTNAYEESNVYHSGKATIYSGWE